MTGPAADRPLTAGDVPLLRKGDVLLHRDGRTARLDFVYGDGLSGTYGDRSTFANSPPSSFTFVRRPAASDEGVGRWHEIIDRIVPAIAPMDAIEASEFCCEHTLQLDRDRIRRELAALASPPVSERERELEGALDKAVSRFRHCAEMIEAGFNIPGTTRVEHAMKVMAYADEAARALTAQPAGEPQ